MQKPKDMHTEEKKNELKEKKNWHEEKQIEHIEIEMLKRKREGARVEKMKQLQRNIPGHVNRNLQFFLPLCLHCLLLPFASLLYYSAVHSARA